MMKSKCGKLKIKGSCVENKIDTWLSKCDFYCGYTKYQAKLFKQVKTYIQNLNCMIKSLNEKIDDMWDTIEDCEGEISQLRKEKEKLKQELYETNGNLEFKIDEKYFWKDCCLKAEQKVKEQSSLINQLQYNSDSLSVIVDELREEKECEK